MTTVVLQDGAWELQDPYPRLAAAAQKQASYKGPLKGMGPLTDYQCPNVDLRCLSFLKTVLIQLLPLVPLCTAAVLIIVAPNALPDHTRGFPANLPRALGLGFKACSWRPSWHLLPRGSWA